MPYPTKIFESGFFGSLRQQAIRAGLWDTYIHHPFIQHIADGTLPLVSFRYYLTQDYLYLIHFTRAHALLTSKLYTLSDIKMASKGFLAALEEMSLHKSYVAQWGLDETQVLAAPEAPETMAYTRYLMDIGQSGDALAMLVALMPCMTGYAEIGQWILRSPNTKISGNPYAAWIRQYDSPTLLKDTKENIDFLEKIAAQQGGECRLTALSKIFNQAVRLESAFWQMGLNIT